MLAGKQREVVVVFSPQLYEGQLRGLQQAMAHCRRELEEMGLRPRFSVETAQRILEKMRSRQYFRRLLDYRVEEDEQGVCRSGCGVTGKSIDVWPRAILGFGF